MPQSLSQTHRISIHAPAKGATILRTKDPLCVEFQSTLPRRERHIIFVSCPSSLHFNSRSREGSDGIQQHVTLTRSIISIHAPAKGATGSSFTACCSCPDFNSRSREGSDHLFPHRIYTYTQFQFTLPRRERQWSTALDGCV